jgi:hypothetical protein
MTMFNTITPIATPTIEMTVIMEMKASDLLLQRYRSAIFREKAHEDIGGRIATRPAYVNEFRTI